MLNQILNHNTTNMIRYDAIFIIGVGMTLGAIHSVDNNNNVLTEMSGISGWKVLTDIASESSCVWDDGTNFDYLN